MASSLGAQWSGKIHHHCPVRIVEIGATDRDDFPFRAHGASLMIVPQSMGFPATDRGGSLEAQRYYGGRRVGYWVSVQGGWADRLFYKLQMSDDGILDFGETIMSIWDVFDSIGNALDSGLRTVLSAGDTVVECV